MRSTLRFLQSKRGKTSKSSILEIYPSLYISLKHEGKVFANNLTIFFSVSCLFVFFNLDDEFGAYIFFNRLN